MRIELYDMQAGYVQVCQQVLRDGYEVSPRGQRTREVLGASLVLHNPEYSLPYMTGRDIRPELGYAEALQLVGGVSHPELMAKITKVFRRFQSGGTFHGAYGVRTAQQLPFVLDRLRTDAHSRQAVLQIWDPARDLQFLTDTPADLPCTLSLQFLLRGGALHCVATMRSNDVWLGLAYDVYQFTFVQRVLANVLEVKLGTYTHNAGSLHVYERDWERVEALEVAEGSDLPSETPVAGRPGEDFSVVRHRVRNMLTGNMLPGYTDAEDEITSALRPYTS
jgi:thymidylate synthase